MRTDIIFWAVFLIALAVLIVWLLPYISTQVVSKVDISNATTLLNWG